MSSRPLALLLALPALLLAACGDDEGGGSGGSSADDEKAITKVLQDGLTTKDVNVACEGTLSEDFLTRVYGSADKCRTIESKDLKDEQPPESVDVSQIEVDGKAGTATVKLTGGDDDGATGPIDVVKQGEDWRVKDLSAEFLRSQLKASLAKDDEFDEATRKCLGDKLLGLDDAELRKVAYGTIGEQPAAQQQLVELVGECDASAGGEGGGDSDVGFVRRKFEEGIASSLKAKGASEKAIECVKQELRKSISDEELDKLVGAGGKDVPPAIEKAATQAILECDAVEGSSGS